MKVVADLHIHSHYSRATSKNLNFEHLVKWAQLKGVHLVGTGDISHPGWLQEMRDKLEPAEAGLFRLKHEFARDIQSEVPQACQAPVRFMLAGEISSIYKKHDKVRKIHNIIFAPSLAAVEKIQAALEKIGNIRSDGRPILGLDSRDLLEIILDIDPQNYLIPAHIWTPWFSLLGSKSGFDSVQECFDDLTSHIFALETGLSSDPPMNWRVSDLDRYTLVSNSDAHSPPKLAREASLFDTELSYPAIFKALRTGDPQTFLGTLEFFPEEGKYHYDGHRKCGTRWDPTITRQHQGICSECGKPVTVGVMHRVATLADRTEGQKPTRTHPFRSLIPLPEVLAEVLRVGPGSKRVSQTYELLLAKFGSELKILLDVPLEEIERAGGSLLAEGMRRMRRGEVSIAAGYDGEYGVIKLFEDEERDSLAGQLSLFAPPQQPSERKPVDQQPPSISGQIVDTQTPDQWTQTELFGQPNLESPPKHGTASGQLIKEKLRILGGLNGQQREAARCTGTPLIIVAGPGTGKTRTLTYRLAFLITEQGVPPDNILAITFTNKAAQEMAGRLTAMLGSGTAGQLVIKTFHALGTMILRQNGQVIDLEPGFSICSERDRQTLLRQACPELNSRKINQYLEQISAVKNQLLGPESPEIQPDLQFADIYRRYEGVLQNNQVCDFDDLILRPVKLFESSPQILEQYQNRFGWVSVDEYQDINLAQYRLLRLLTARGANLCVIGDPDQAIYGFRGANRAYFLKFQQDFPEAKIMHLDQNYRSTQIILNAAGQVITQSPDSRQFELWSDIIDPTRLVVYAAPTDKAEAEYVVHEIEKMVGGTSYFSLDSGRVDDDGLASRSFADFAVLYRLGAQSQPLIEAFQRSGIPYQSIGQTPLVEHKDIWAVLACLQLLHNPKTTFHLAQIGSKKQEQMVISCLTAMEVNSLIPVSMLIEQIQQLLADRSILAFDDKGIERLQQLKRRASVFDNRLGDFLESIVLQKETDLYDPRADRVTLMTLHASKGLEFPVVFLVGCEEKLIPYQRTGQTFDLEEERRLFFVGMTRAQQKLILTHAQTRFLFGQTEKHDPSRFLTDIENNLKELKRMSPKKSTKEKGDPPQLRLF